MGDTKERLNKVLASQMAVGRRQADMLIEKGNVSVNHQPARLGQRVGPDDFIEVNGKRVAIEAKQYVYLLLNKPVGYVCSRRQQGVAPTIYSLIPQEYQHLKPVGRLDKDSSGILLMTNDGDLALQMTHPRFSKEKTYVVELDKPLESQHRQMITTRGVELADGVSQFELHPVARSKDRTWIVNMHEGRNRQIRRTFAAVGYTVQKLHRKTFGPFDESKLNGKVYQEVSTPH
jgi:23S rRNA pseudouridine2605 synthase